MRGAYFQYMKVKGVPGVPDACAVAKEKYAEECELRLGRIMNGKEPGYEKPKHKSMKALRTFALYVLLSSALCVQSAGPSVTLAWDDNPTEVGLLYRLHYGAASRTYTHTREAGEGLMITVGDLTPGATYFFAVTARFPVEPGVESEFSNEVEYLVPTPGLDAPKDVGYVIENGKTILIWAAPVIGSGVTRHKIYHAMGTGLMTFYAVTQDGANRFDLGILPAGHHRWAVTAQRGGLEESELSREVEFWKAPVPTGFRIFAPPNMALKVTKP